MSPPHGVFIDGNEYPPQPVCIRRSRMRILIGMITVERRASRAEQESGDLVLA